jgi:hypothetical protein
MSARAHFEALGKLKKASSKPLQFQLGPVFFHANWSRDGAWMTMTDGPYLQHDWIRIGLVEHTDGTRTFCAVVWRLSIRLAWI